MNIAITALVIAESGCTASSPGLSGDPVNEDFAYFKNIFFRKPRSMTGFYEEVIWENSRRA